MNNSLKSVLRKSGIILSATLALAASSSSFASDAKFNIRVSPFALLIGMVDVEADVKVHDKITVSPMFTTWGVDVGSSSIGLTGYGVRANYHFNGALKQGGYVSAFYKHWAFDATESNLVYGNITGTASANVFAGMVGYMWMWDNVNMNAGLGYGFGSAGDIELKDSRGTVRDTADGSSAKAGYSIDLSVGYAF